MNQALRRRRPMQIATGYVFLCLAVGAALTAAAADTISSARPHVLLHAPREYYERFPLDKITLPKITLDDLEDLPPRFRKPNRVVKQIVEDDLTWRKGVQAYLANINFADECVGLLLDALDASPYRDNTIVMLWSDHGLHQGEKFQFSNFTVWEESARCVLICAAPGVKAGSKCHQPVNLLDMYPTLLEMCGSPPKVGLSGESFVPQFSEPSRARPLTRHGSQDWVN